MSDQVEKACPPNQAWSTDASLWMQLGYNIGSVSTEVSSPVEAGVSLIAGDISTLPCMPYESLEDGSWRLLKTHAAFRLMRKPNHYQTISDFLNYMIRSVLLWGNAYAWVDRNRRGEPMAIYPVSPRSVMPAVAPDGSVFYSIMFDDLMRDEGGDLEETLVPAGDIFHHRIMYDRHPLKGVSPLYAIGDAAALNSSIAQNMAAFHKNAARPSGILQTPAGLKPEARERLRDQLRRQFTGANAGGTIVLDFEMKYQQVSMSASESQATQLLEYSIEEVARALRIPRHMLLLDSGGSTQNIETSMRLYHTHALRPHIVNIEMRLNDLFGFDGVSRRFQFDVQQLFRAEITHRIDALSKGIQNGIMTPNEARISEGLAPIDGGENLYLQRQMTPASLITELAAAELAGKSATTANAQEQDQQGADSEAAPPQKSAAAPLPQDFDFNEMISRHLNQPVERDAAEWSDWITSKALELA